MDPAHGTLALLRHRDDEAEREADEESAHDHEHLCSICIVEHGAAEELQYSHDSREIVAQYTRRFEKAYRDHERAHPEVQSFIVVHHRVTLQTICAFSHLSICPFVPANKEILKNEYYFS